MRAIRKGWESFLWDMRHSLPVSATVAVAFLAFLFVMLVIWGAAHA
jgi:hypothetical protein